MKYLVCFLIICCFNSVFSQNNPCNLEVDRNIGITVINKNDLFCIAKNSDTPTTTFYTFTSWCPDGRKDIDNAIELEKRYNTTLYIIMVESQNDKNLKEGIDLIKSKNSLAKIIVLNDDVYGSSTRKRNNTFIADVSSLPKKFNPGYGHYIVISKDEVLLKAPLVTPKKIGEKPQSWATRQEFVKDVIVPLLEEK